MSINRAADKEDMGGVCICIYTQYSMEYFSATK